MDYTIEALIRLMPLGGWTYNEIDGVTVHEDGIANGYSTPTQEDIAAETSRLEHNTPILADLAVLDKFVSRETEDLIITANTDSFLVGKANEKKILRAKLK